MTLLNWIDHLDKALVVLIQHDSDHALLDPIMIFLREPLVWIPFYAFMAWYAISKGKSKAWSFILLTVLTFAITDSLAAQVLKPMFVRLRPCHDPDMQAVLRSLVDCGGLYSMPSNHAANHFGLATFWYFAIRSMNGAKWRWLFVWAAIICYAQIYVGKHYPSDILVGSLTGILTGWGMSRLFIYWENRQGHGPRPSILNKSFKNSPGMDTGL